MSKAKKEEDALNPCGHRNSERVAALKKLPSAVCPACLLERIAGLEAELKTSNEMVNALHKSKKQLQAQIGYQAKIGAQQFESQRVEIEQLQAENKQLRSIKCPPISDGDTCICPIEELEEKLKWHKEEKLRLEKEVQTLRNQALKGSK